MFVRLMLNSTMVGVAGKDVRYERHLQCEHRLSIACDIDSSLSYRIQLKANVDVGTYPGAWPKIHTGSCYRKIKTDERGRRCRLTSECEVRLMA
jgi:hypothetical protein